MSHPTYPQPLNANNQSSPLSNAVSSSDASFATSAATSFTNGHTAAHTDPHVTAHLSAMTATKLQQERVRDERERSSTSTRNTQQPPQRTATVHPSNLALLPPSSTSPSPSLSPTRQPAASVSSSNLSPPSVTTPPGMHPSQRYQLTGQVLGKGHFARVCLALDTLCDNRRVAVKQIDKKDMNKNRGIVEAEMSILKKMGTHAYIVGMLDWWEDERKFHIVMELCDGGDLFSKIVEQGKYSEREAVRCCRQIAEALVYMHGCGVIHRDLKPENILLLNSAIDSTLKIADFGLSKIVSSIDDVMRTVCGTWAYCAPEVISHKTYTSKVDNWTLGVLMYILLCGYHPFDCYGDLPEPELLDKIMKVEYEFEDPVWDTVSDQAKQLIRRLLRYKPEERMSLTEYLQSEWITGSAASSATTSSTVIAVRLSKMNHRAFRAVVTAKVAAKKFRASISKSPRTPTATSRTGMLVPPLGAEGDVAEPGAAGGGGVGGGDRAGGSLSGGSGGLSFLQRLDATGRRSVGNSTDLTATAKHSPSSHSSRNKQKEQQQATHTQQPANGGGGSGGAGTEREKGGLGRGMRISEEDMDDVEEYSGEIGNEEEKELNEEDL